MTYTLSTVLILRIFLSSIIKYLFCSLSGIFFFEGNSVLHMLDLLCPPSLLFLNPVPCSGFIFFDSFFATLCSCVFFPVFSCFGSSSFHLTSVMVLFSSNCVLNPDTSYFMTSCFPTIFLEYWLCLW